MAVNLIDRIFLGATHGKGEAIARAHGAIATGGLKLHKVGQVLESDADIEAHIQDRAQFFFAEFLPYLRLLGVTG